MKVHVVTMVEWTGSGEETRVIGVLSEDADLDTFLENEGLEANTDSYRIDTQEFVVAE